MSSQSNYMSIEFIESNKFAGRGKRLERQAEDMLPLEELSLIF